MVLSMERRFVFRLSPRCFAPRGLGVIVCLVAVLLSGQALGRVQGPPSFHGPVASTPPANTFVLAIGRPMEREFAGRQKDIFQLPLAEGQYASVIIDHRGSDLTIRLLDPQGIAKIEVDSHPGQPRDTFELVAEKSGTYEIQLEPEYPKAPAGKYQISIGEIRAANIQDRTLYDARLQYSEALRLYPAGAYEKAQLLAARALDLREKALGPDQPEVAETLNLLGVICTARSDYNRAELLFQRALAINEKAFGSEYPAVAEVTDNLAKNFNARGNYAEAKRLARKALGIREKALGQDHYLVAVSLGTLGDIFLAKGDYADARVLSERALHITARSYTADDLPHADAASLLARVEIKLGNYSAAEQLLTNSLQTRETIAGKESLQAADSIYDLGYLYLIKNDNLKAEQMNLLALALKEKILGSDHLQISLILHNLGLIHYRRGD